MNDRMTRAAFLPAPSPLVGESWGGGDAANAERGTLPLTRPLAALASTLSLKGRGKKEFAR